jgi:hypothetical protein
MEATTETTGPGSSKREILKLIRTMAQCPDAGGIGRGVLKFSQKETKSVDRPGGGRVLSEVTLTLDAQVLVHFNDEATVTSVDVIGDWSWLAVTRSYTGPGGAGQQLTRHAVGGTHTGTASPNGHGESITTATTNASGPGMVVYGDLFGAVAHMITEGVVQELVRESTGRANDGTCAHLVAEPATVHVKPGATVAIGARLTEAPRLRPVKASQGSAGGTVSPAEAQASPVATFTYSALPSRPEGGKDTVTFTHVSNQGRAVPKTVTIIYDEAFPRTISGTIGGLNKGDGMNTNWDGTLVLQLRDQDPRTGRPDAEPTYQIVDGSVHWTSKLESPCSGDGEGTLSASQLVGVLTIRPTRTPTGWRWSMLITGKRAATGRTMPVNGTCPSPPDNHPEPVEADAYSDYLAFGYNTYDSHASQPENYTSPDLVDFTGRGIATNDAGNQQWRWRLTAPATG